MTFIGEEDPDKPAVWELVLFTLMSISFLATSIYTAYLGYTQPYYRSSIAIRYFFPCSSLIYVLENVTLAMVGTILTSYHNVWVYMIFALQACIVPVLLNVLYEITYLVHKRRSVNFCGLFFDEGKRVKVITTPVRSWILRNLIRIVSLLLLIIGIIANFDLLQEGRKSRDAGFSGWYGLTPWDPTKVHLLLSLLPTMVLILVSLYESLVLWRYGTSSSMVVHSSICNPWFFPMFGTIALGVGQLFPAPIYPVSSNLGVLVYLFTIILLMHEVDKDMVATEDFTDFLAEVAKTGNAISVRHVRPPLWVDRTSGGGAGSERQLSPSGGGGGISGAGGERVASSTVLEASEEEEEEAGVGGVVDERVVMAVDEEDDVEVGGGGGTPPSSSPPNPPPATIAVTEKDDENEDDYANADDSSSPPSGSFVKERMIASPSAVATE